MTWRRRRLLSCVEAWPECVEGDYNPACCRFPKSCSCTVYDDDLDDGLLEPVVPDTYPNDPQSPNPSPPAVLPDRVQ
jgi:hypothetical protein